MKRAFVPTALHAELVEYAGLVRVLRTARTLDLTAHLVQHAGQRGEAPDTWTAWPLIDCPVPEWSLDDEIRHLADAVVRAVAGDDSDSDADADSPAASHHLVLRTGAVLVHILALLADQRPSAPGSMQNRLWAMNWEDVLSLLSVSGALDPSIVARAEMRLERLYGPSSTKAIARRAMVTSAEAKRASLDAVAEDQLFAPPVLSRSHRSDDKGARHKSGVKSRAVVDTDTDTDA